MVVEHDVDLPELLQGCVHNLLAILLLGQIKGEQFASPSVFLGFLLSLLSIALLFRQVRDKTVSTFHGEEDGGSTANAGVTTGDNGGPILQLSGSLVDLVAAIFGRNVL